MIHPDTKLAFINDTIGYGVVATEFIPKGTITWILDDLDQQLPPSYVYSLDNLRKQEVIKYSYRDRKGNYILCWDRSRFINHSSHANCMSTPYEFELAIRDIYPGEELTDDYGTLNLDQPFECLREIEDSRTKIMPNDLLNFYEKWDQQAQEAMTYFNQVKQPLQYLLSDIYRDKVMSVALGKEKMESIISCYYDTSQNYSHSQSN